MLPRARPSGSPTRAGRSRARSCSCDPHAPVGRAKPTGVEVDSAAVKVLLVGSGGREHALAWKLAQAPGLAALHAAPGNPGIARLGDCHPVRAEDGEALLGLARSLDVDLAVIGPEAPLVAGVADELRRNGVAVFGPGRSAARIEGSKSFAKDVHGRGRRPDRRVAGGRACSLCRQGRRARGREGRVRLRDGRAARRGAARRLGVPRADRDRGAPRRRGGVGLRARRRAAGGAARARSGLQADRRRRHGPEHRRHGLVLAGARDGRRRGGGARRAGAPARSSRSSPGAGRRSSACSSPG